MAYQLIVNWLYLLFDPEHNYIDYFEVLKTLGGAHSYYWLPCGFSTSNRKRCEGCHFGYKNGKRKRGKGNEESWKRQLHKPDMMLAYQKLKYTVTRRPTNIANSNTVEANQTFMDVWTKVMPAQFRQDAERADLIEKLIIY